MAREIERKFLVNGDAWRDAVVSAVRLVDGLLAASKGRKVRVRLYPDRATIAVKTRRRSRVRLEYEYAIPTDDALEMLKSECGRSVLAKTRYHVRYGAHTWEVDVYEAPLDGVVIAEVELRDSDETFVLPPWVDREVTDDPAFSKQRLFAARAQRRFVASAARPRSDKASR
jgi:CYTH domain-containing protein